jgi:hypothetical protein
LPLFQPLPRTGLTEAMAHGLEAYFAGHNPPGHAPARDRTLLFRTSRRRSADTQADLARTAQTKRFRIGR